MPDLRGEVEALLARIAALHAAAPDVPLRPIHGAPHPTAWLLDGERLGLVDFDRLALGHPERDVAALPAGAPEVADAFARGFGELDATRLEAYRLERGLAKALRATYDLSEDAHERAARRLREAAGRSPRVNYGVVVDSVNVSVLLYVPVRSASLALIRWLKPSVTASLDTGPL